MLETFTPARLDDEVAALTLRRCKGRKAATGSPPQGTTGRAKPFTGRPHGPPPVRGHPAGNGVRTGVLVFFVGPLPDLIVPGRTSPLDPSRSTPLQQGQDLLEAHQSDISVHGVLEAGGRGGELDRFLEILSGQQAVDDAGRKGIPPAHAVHDRLKTEFLAGVEALAVIEHARPGILRRRMTF